MRKTFLGRQASANALTRLGAVMMLVAFVTACENTSGLRQHGASVAAAGQSVSQVALDATTEITALQDTMANYRAIDVVLKAKADDTDLQIKSAIDKANSDKKFTERKNKLAASLARWGKAYKALAKTYQSFQKLADPAFEADVETAANDFRTAVTGLDAIKKVPDLSGVAKLLVAQLQAGKIREHNNVLLKLAEGYADTWSATGAVLKTEIDMIYSDHIATFHNPVVGQFTDTKKLQAQVSYPVPTHKLAWIYRIEEVRKLEKERDLLKAKLRAVDKAFSALKKAHLELAKEKPSFQVVIESVQTINTFAKSF